MADLHINRRPAPSLGHIVHPKRAVFSVDRFGIVQHVNEAEGAILRRLTSVPDLTEVRA